MNYNYRINLTIDVVSEAQLSAILDILMTDFIENKSTNFSKFDKLFTISQRQYYTKSINSFSLSNSFPPKINEIEINLLAE